MKLLGKIICGVLSLIAVLAMVLPINNALAQSSGQDYCATPPFTSASAPPFVMIVMGRNHKLFYEAYNDASDINGDGKIDLTYKPTKIEYYGYFDSYKCYKYNGYRFEPTCDSDPDSKKCEGVGNNKWSGDFLNYLTMSRMDALRKVLYGGKRSTDEDDETVLERAYIPQDAHSWGKSYNSTTDDGYDISKYSPFSQPQDGKRHLFASTTLSAPDSDGDYKPRLRVLKNNEHRIWEWTAKERPVCGSSLMNDDGTEDNIDSRKIDDYTVRVEVGECSESDSCGVYSGSLSYPDSDSPKPVGLLQRYGKDGDMHFGLLTGSYTNNISGGVLRKNIGSVEDEIDQNTGEFTDSKGIIHTIDHLRIINFNYSGHSYDGGRYAGGPMPTADSDFPDWGNPVAEMLYESLNYYSGGSPTDSFDDDVDDGDDEGLDLPNPNWEDPYNSTDFCAEAHILTISDIYPNFDSDEVPGAKWGSMNPETIGDSDNEKLDAQAIGNEIFNEEIGSQKNRFIGCSGIDDCDYSCEDKNVDSLGNIRGLCPDEPTRQGSYYTASVAHYARTNDLSSVQKNQTVTNYMVGLSSPRPRIEIPVMGGKVTVVPFAKSVGGSGSYGINPGKDDYQPTDTIVDYFVEDITPTRGSFRINFEDVEQAADYDMDAIVRYTYQLVDSSGDPVDNPTAGSEVKITVESEYAAGSIIQHLGYIISGTQSDDTYLVVRDDDTAADNDPDYFLDKPKNDSWDDDEELPKFHEKTFTPSSTEAATTLKNPLWYAAKWGGFEDLNDNGVPDLQDEWDFDKDGQPDSYFYVQNPLQLEKQLNEAFSQITQQSSSGTSIASLTERATCGSTIAQAVFYPEIYKNNRKVTWLGYLHSYWFFSNSNTQNLREDHPDGTDKTLDVLQDNILDFKTASGELKIDVYNSSENGTKDEHLHSRDSLDALHTVWDAGRKLRDRNATKRDIYSVDSVGNDADLIEFNATNADVFKNWLGDEMSLFPDCLLDGIDPQYGKLIRYVRGESIPGCRSRRTGEGVWKLGDIINSTPATVDYGDYSLAFTGSNDGMLHAFHMGKLVRGPDEMQPTELQNSMNDEDTDKVGKEVWAFVPRNTMPYLRFLADTNYNHINMVDLRPYIINKKNSDKKILIGGMRFGGATGDDSADSVNPPADTCDPSTDNCTGRSAYFALNVTDPDDPKHMWTFSHEKLGFSFSGPAYIKRKDSFSDTWKHYVMFASGPTTYDGTSSQALNYFVVNLETGAVERKTTEKDDDAKLNKDNAFGGRLFTDGLDVDEDGQTDYVLSGYSQVDGQSAVDGGVISIYTGDAQPSGWNFDKTYFNSKNPVISSVTSMKCWGQWYIYFGTGQYFSRTDKKTHGKNHLYGVPFACDAEGNCGTSGAINMNNIHSKSDGNFTCSNIYMKKKNANKGSWKIKLDYSKDKPDLRRERSYSKPSASSFNTVFYDSDMPTSNPCKFGGKTRSWARNCATGMAMSSEHCPDFTVNPGNFAYLIQLSGGGIPQKTKEDFNGDDDDSEPGVTDPDEGLSGPGGDLIEGGTTSGEILLWLEK